MKRWQMLARQAGRDKARYDESIRRFWVLYPKADPDIKLLLAQEHVGYVAAFGLANLRMRQQARWWYRWFLRWIPG